GAFLLVGLRRAILAHVKIIEQIVHDVAEARLVVDQPLEPVEVLARAVLEQRAPELDQAARRRRRRHAGQPLAHQHGKRLLDRRVGAVGDLVELAAMEAVVDHGGEIFGNARHAPRPDRLDAGLLDRLEHRARGLPAGHELPVHVRIVTGELERDRVGMPAHDRSLGGIELARGLRQPRLAADDAGALGREADLKIGLLRDRAHAARHRALERLGRAFLRGRLRLDVGGHDGSVVLALNFWDVALYVYTYGVRDGS